MAKQESSGGSGVADRLRSEARGLVGALGSRALSSVRGRLDDATGRLTQYVEGGGGPGIMAAVKGAKGAAEGKPKRGMLKAGMSFVREKVSGMFKRGGRGGKKLKLTNIVESIDVGVPIKVAYNQWTQYSDFPKFTKKIDNADHNKAEGAKVNWKAQVFWSHRAWEATIMDQVPDDHIVWRSKGQKGHVDGSVTFHELTPNLTRILLVLEYHPQGLFERTGNLWRAQGRRARLELKHFQRHIMSEGILHPDDLEGWRGTIHDGEVAESHEDAMEREQKESEQDEQDTRGEQNGDRRAAARRRDDAQEDEAQEDGAQEDEAQETEARETEAKETEAEKTDDETDDETDEETDAPPRRSTRSRRPASASQGTQGNGRRRPRTAAQRGGNR